jgi:hypothetical protein
MVGMWAFSMGGTSVALLGVVTVVKRARHWASMKAVSTAE